jgi:LacI family transcriptional regulator
MARRPRNHGSDPVRGRPVSIQDVASHASVSITTVSRVINSPGLVSPATAERVRESIRELGYRPNVFARGLMTRQSRVIGILLPDIHGEFYSELLRGADAEAKRSGYHLLISSDVQPDGEGTATIPYGFLDGLAVMVTEPSHKSWDEATQLGMPVCLLDEKTSDGTVDSVVIDNGPGTREATEHLLAHTPASRCVFVGGTRENFDAQERARVFNETLEGAGHEVRASQTSFGEFTADWGGEWASGAIADGSLRGSAVFAGNDEIAFGVMMAASEAGLSPRRDYQLIGFDDTRLCTLVRPMLSSVRVPLRELGAAAVELLVRRLEDPEARPEQRLLRTTLVERETSG